MSLEHIKPRPRHRTRSSLGEISKAVLQGLRGGSSGGGSWPRSSLMAASATSKDPGSPQVPANFPAFLRLSRTEIFRKFEDLHWDQQLRLSQGQRPSQSSSVWARPFGPVVSERNRYSNIDPFTNNRVRLRVPDGIDDYINASPIALTDSKNGNVRRFIATQGPKESNLSHLWRMMWAETGPPSTPAVIVMLTQTHEAGREKCFQYYPLSLSSPILDVSDTDIGDGFTASVELVDAKDEPETRATLRTMKLKVGARSPDAEQETSSCKTIYHYLFEGWPDFTVPEEPEDRAGLVELVQRSAARAGETGASRAAESQNGQEPAGISPRIVHCSAGVGRSGTFIALDYLLSELQAGVYDSMDPPDFDPIASTVDNLRKQRMMMVQGEAQFQFLYDILRELWIKRHESRKKTEKEHKNGKARDC